MKRILLALVMICGSAIAETEYGYFIRSDANSEWNPSSVTINTGDRFKFLMTKRLNSSSTNTSIGSGYISNGNVSFEFIIGFETFVGPLTITPKNTSSVLYATYQIIRSSETESSASLAPLNIISLPADNNGDLDLLIETSTDLQSWTPIYSDSIGATGAASFIRTRLIQD